MRFVLCLIGGLGLCAWHIDAKNGDALRMASCAAKRRFSGPTRRVTIGELDGDGVLSMVRDRGLEVLSGIELLTTCQGDLRAFGDAPAVERSWS